MIAITFAQAPQTGPAADSSSCCATPEYPNLRLPRPRHPAPPRAVKPSGGGGRVGMLLISPYVLAGSVDEAGYFNHYSFLRSVEELFGLSPSATPPNLRSRLRRNGLQQPRILTARRAGLSR